VELVRDMVLSRNGMMPLGRCLYGRAIKNTDPRKRTVNNHDETGDATDASDAPLFEPVGFL
jgi:hypothetical protein